MYELPNGLQTLFPAHKASLHLTHNKHKDYYETVESYIGNFNHEPNGWVSEEQRKKSIETQELWELQWYPSTPIGSYSVIGADLEVVLQRAKEMEIDDQDSNQ